MAPIADFVAVLEDYEWPAFPAFSDPFDANQLENLVSEIYPDLSASIEETIVEWWSWAGSLNSEVLNDIVVSSEGELLLPLQLAPDGARVGRLAHLLEFLRIRPFVEKENQQFFPVLGADHNCLHALRRPSHSEPWQIWFLEREGMDWETPQRSEEQAPTFEDYLEQITIGLRTGHLIIGDRGGIERAEPPVSYYPWA